MHLTLGGGVGIRPALYRVTSRGPEFTRHFYTTRTIQHITTWTTR
jgi:hypothetical protein